MHTLIFMTRQSLRSHLDEPKKQKHLYNRLATIHIQKVHRTRVLHNARLHKVYVHTHGVAQTTQRHTIRYDCPVGLHCSTYSRIWAYLTRTPNIVSRGETWQCGVLWSDDRLFSPRVTLRVSNERS